ncbi:alpha-hydroxy acid oxidase [Angustibacter sp. McL0619]|uniref:alpha-hydroxy acid oxidase n=1 Tax=Angustibacter sp. McL0619 TaxID=3415676 RepID=UPI003CF6C0AA
MSALVDAQRAAARELLDPAALAYYESGAGSEITRREARAAWSHYRLRPRVLTDVADVDLSLELFGARLRTPLLVAPTAFHRLAHAEGELATARGATASGSLMVVSTRSSTPLEVVAEACGGPWWFQVYATRDPAVHRALALRARDAGATALVLTGDTPYVGRKPRSDGPGVPGIEQMIAVNTAQHLAPGAAADAVDQTPAVTVAMIDELATLTGLPVLVKGVLRGDEAARCVAAGAAGVVVSTHGGRQLDRVVPSAYALPDVVAAVGERVPVLVDGGICSGLDALTALALGARAVLLGRPVLWALAAGGADGVRELLDTLGDDLEHVMALAGAPRLADLTPDLVTAGGGATAWGHGASDPGH